MANPLESFSEGVFVKDVARLGGEALKQRADINAGVPDRLVWLPIKSSIQASPMLVWFWVEWKRKGDKGKKIEPMPHQLVYHERLRAAGHTVYVFDNNREAREVLRGYML